MKRAIDPRLAILAGIAVLLAAAATMRLVLAAPLSAGSLTNRGLRQESRGDLNSAWVHLNAVATLRPEDPAALLREARALRRLERLEDARALLEKACLLDDRSSRLHYELAKTLAASGLWAEADTALGAALARSKTHADAIQLRAGVAAAEGNVSRAVVLYELALLRGASNPARVRIDPLYDPVRHDPEFSRVVLARLVPGVYREGSS